MSDNTYDSSLYGYFTSAAVEQSIKAKWHRGGNLAAGNEGKRFQSEDKSQDQSHEASPVQVLYSDPAYNDFYQVGQLKLSRPSHLVEINCGPPSEVSELMHLEESTTRSHKKPVGKHWEDKLSQNLQSYKEKQCVVSSYQPSTTAPPCAHPQPSHSLPPLVPSVAESQLTSETQTVVSARQSYWQQCSVAPAQPLTTVNTVAHNNCELNEGRSKSNEQELMLPLNSHQANADNQNPSLSDNESDGRDCDGPSNPNKSGNQNEQDFKCNSDGDLGLGELFGQSGQDLCVENKFQRLRFDFPLEFWTKEMLFWHSEKLRLNKSLRRRYKKKGYWSDKIHERAKEASRRFRRLYRECEEELHARTDLDVEDLKRRKLEAVRAKRKCKVLSPTPEAVAERKSKVLSPTPEAVPSTSEESQPPSRRHWHKETKLTEHARRQAVARVMEKVFSNAEPFSRFHGLKDVVKTATAEERKLNKYNWDISCRNVDNSKFSQNLHSINAEAVSVHNNAMPVRPFSSGELRDDSLLAQPPEVMRGYPRYGPYLLPKSRNSAPNVLNCPPNWRNCSPKWRNCPPSMHYGPPNVFKWGPRFVGRGPDHFGRSPVPIYDDIQHATSGSVLEHQSVLKSRVVDVGLPSLYSMADRVEDNVTVPVEKHLFSGCLIQPHSSKGGPFKRDSFIVPPQDNFLPLRDGPTVDRRDRDALVAPSKLVCYKEGELCSGAVQGVFSGKILKETYCRTPVYDPFTNSGLPEDREQPTEGAVYSPQQTEGEAMDDLRAAENITKCSFGQNEPCKRKHNYMSADKSSNIKQMHPTSAPDDPELQKLLKRVQGNLQKMNEDNHHQIIGTSRALQDRKYMDLSKRVKTLVGRKHAHGTQNKTDQIYRSHDKRCVEDLAKNVIKKLSERKDESNITNVDITKNSIPAKLTEGAVDQGTNIYHAEKGVEKISTQVTPSRVVKPGLGNAHLKKFDKSKKNPEEQSVKEQISVSRNKVENSDCSPPRPAENTPSLLRETEPVPPPDNRSRTIVQPAHNITNVPDSHRPNLSELLRRIEVNLDNKMKSDKEQGKDRDLILSGVRQSRLTAEDTCVDGRQKGRSKQVGEIAGIPERLRDRLGGKVDPW